MLSYLTSWISRVDDNDSPDFAPDEETLIFGEILIKPALSWPPLCFSPTLGHPAPNFSTHPDSSQPVILYSFHLFRNPNLLHIVLGKAGAVERVLWDSDSHVGLIHVGLCDLRWDHAIDHGDIKWWVMWEVVEVEVVVEVVVVEVVDVVGGEQDPGQ